MVTERYLVITRRGNARMTSRLPTLRNGEILLKLKMNIDPSVFTDVIPVAEMELNRESIATGIDVRIERQGRTQIIQYDDAVINHNRQLEEIIGVYTPRTTRHRDPAQDE